MPRLHAHPDLFALPEAPEGFRYARDVLSFSEECDLIKRFEDLPFQHFDFHGYRGNRRIVAYGWHYDYAARQVRPSSGLPKFLAELKERAGDFARRPPSDFEQVLVTEYAPGAGIGWHKDKPQFGEVVAFSFSSSCKLRFRRPDPPGWDRRMQVVEPRSAYILTGQARWNWEHSIPAVETARYSVTFRTWSPPST